MTTTTATPNMNIESYIEYVTNINAQLYEMTASKEFIDLIQKMFGIHIPVVRTDNEKNVDAANEFLNIVVSAYKQCSRYPDIWPETMRLITLLMSIDTVDKLIIHTRSLYGIIINLCKLQQKIDDATLSSVGCSSSENKYTKVNSTWILLHNELIKSISEYLYKHSFPSGIIVGYIPHSSY